MVQPRRRAMKIRLIALSLIGVFGMAIADEPTVEVGGTNEKPFDLRKVISEPVQTIVKEGRTCYQETTIQKMVEACYEGKTYYTSVAEKSRVKIKCPAKKQ
jgi:hypothetical protein